MIRSLVVPACRRPRRLPLVTRVAALVLLLVPTGAHARPAGSVRQAALLVRGTDRYGNFEPAEWPKDELGENEVRAHERAVSLYRDAYLEEEAKHAKRSAQMEKTSC